MSDVGCSDVGCWVADSLDAVVTGNWKWAIYEELFHNHIKLFSKRRKNLKTRSKWRFSGLDFVIYYIIVYHIRHSIA